jgi:hypothetical protein
MKFIQFLNETPAVSDLSRTDIKDLVPTYNEFMNTNNDICYSYLIDDRDSLGVSIACSSNFMYFAAFEQCVHWASLFIHVLKIQELSFFDKNPTIWEIKNNTVIERNEQKGSGRG